MAKHRVSTLVMDRIVNTKPNIGGGTNYIRNGNFASGLDFWEQNGTQLSLEVSYDRSILQHSNILSALKVDGGTVGSGVWQDFVSENNKLTLNTQYTLSFVAKAATGSVDIKFGHEQGLTTRTITTEWKRHIVTFTPTQHRNIVFYCGSASGGGKFYISNIKLETGELASDYTNYPFIEEAIQGTTDINGGLALSRVMGVKDQQGKVQAGMNGLNTAENDIRFWAGATVQDMANAPFKVYEDGKIELSNIKKGKEISIKNESIGGINDYLENFTPTIYPMVQNFKNKTADISAGGNVSTITQADFPNNKYEVVAIRQFDLSVSSYVYSQAVATAFVDLAEDEDFALEIKLVNRNTSQVIMQKNNYGHLYGKEYQGGWLIDEFLPQGQYRIECRACIYYKRDYVPSNGKYWGIRVSARIPDLYIKSNTEKVFLRSDGIMCIGDTDEYFYLKQKAEDYFLRLMGKMLFLTPDAQSQLEITNDAIKATGKTDIPGVLASGKATIYGVLSNKWGKLNGASRAEKRSQGVYWLHHAIGHDEYSVNLCPHVENTVATVHPTNRYATYVEIIITRNGTRVDCGFDFQIFGHN